jgi:O-6-methylguanine DNA methyltransferase
MEKKQTVVYQMLSSRMGTFGVVVDFLNGREPIQAVFLPVKKGRLETAIRSEFPDGICKGSMPADRIGKRIRKYLEGGKVLFAADGLDLKRCSSFQKKVLALNFLVPAGKVTTYGRIAEKLGSPKASRAVGTALATNPFPIVIPCHRVVRADGNLGGFGGGLEMKKALLEMEGVKFAKNGHVLPEFII